MSNRSETRKNIVKLLAGAEKPMTRFEIAEAVGIDPESAKLYLRNMVRESEIRSVSKHRVSPLYVLVTNVTKAAEVRATPRRTYVTGSQTEPLKSVGWGSVRESGMIALALPSGGRV